jgi:lipoprotein-anchoring transpeptidase ErfK/SrfK
MEYRIGNRCIQAVLIAGLCMPAWAQDVSAPPVQPTLAQPTTPPVLTPEATVNNPETVTPPPVVSTPAPTPAPTVVKKKGPVDGLKPGQFVWEKREVYEGPLKIVAVLDVQRIYVFQNDKLLGFSTISAGKKGKETPTGYFNILQKNIDHKSNLYSNAPMPYMQRLTWDGIALHGGHIPGYPASHGCIRLPHAFAKALYGVTAMNQEVVVLKDTATPIKRPEPKPVPVIDPPVVPVAPVADPNVIPPASPPKAAPVQPT